MHTRIFIVLIIIIGIIPSILVYHFIHDYYAWTAPLNKVYSLTFVVHQTVPTNTSFATVGNIEIIDDDTIRVVFSDDYNYHIYASKSYPTNLTAKWFTKYIYDDITFEIPHEFYAAPYYPIEPKIRYGEKIWSLPEQFAYTRIINKGDMFITHCQDGMDYKPPRDNNGSLGISIAALIETDIKNGTVGFDRYWASIPLSDGVCRHPQIIERSFDIDWDKFDLERIRQFPQKTLGLNEQFKDPALSCTVSDPIFKKYHSLTSNKDKGTVTIQIDPCGGLYRAPGS